MIKAEANPSTRPRQKWLAQNVAIGSAGVFNHDVFRGPHLPLAGELDAEVAADFSPGSLGGWP
jgi:hypothetical protein